MPIFILTDTVSKKKLAMITINKKNNEISLNFRSV